MQLSIIIINYNTYELTRQCINSIIEHTADLSYEIILVDNASTECEPEVFKRLFPTIKLVTNKVNRGFAGGNNDGIALAKGEVVLLLNSDTLVTDNSITKVCMYLWENLHIGVVSAKLLYPNGNPQSCCQRFPSIQTELIELFRIQKLLSKRLRAQLLMGSFFDHKSMCEVDWVWGTFFMFRREVLQQLPNQQLPEDFFMYGEDLLWCYQIKKLGYSITYFPEATVVHYLSASSIKSKLDKIKLMMNNEYIFLQKNYGKKYAWLVFRLRGLKYLTLRNKGEHFRAYADIYLNF
jgi:GT2 family glycosyltransferase